MQHIKYSRVADPLETQTVLIIFVEIVIVVIYLISLLLVVGRRAKKLLELHNRKYYIIVVFYIGSKLVLCAILVVSIIVGIPNRWTNIDPSTVQLLVKVGIVLADLSIIELFLVALQTYLTHCFSVVSGSITKKRSIFLKYGLKIMQIIVAVALFIPLAVFIVGQLSYTVVNAIDISMNLSIIISFLVAFFYLNFQMTGIMMDKKINNVIKRIYKVQLIILVSRAFSIAFQIIIAFYIIPNTFQQQIATAQKSFQKVIVLGLLFLGTVLFMLLTQGIPIMYSLRSAVVQALNFKTPFEEANEGLQQSFVEQFQGGQIQGELPGYQSMKLINFTQLSDIKADDGHSIWVYKKGEFEGKNILIRISKYQISSFIFQDIENQINHWNQINLKSLSKINYFCEGQIVHLVQRYYQRNLDEIATSLTSEMQSVKIAIKIAQAIRQLHDNQFAHGCLNPRHIFLDGQEVVINGLGLESFKKYLSLITGYTNKTIYTATEYLRDKNNTVLKPKMSADIYSFGVIFYQLVTKNRQYRQLSLKEIQAKFVQQNFRPKLPTNIKAQIKILIRKCWNEQAEKRPTIDQVIQWLKKIS